MAVDIQIVPARASHVRVIARRMREADRNEVFASAGLKPAAALIYSLRKSSVARTALVDGVPEVMFGVGDINILAGVGSPWLLGTDAVERHYVAFLRGSVDWRDQLLRRYSVLQNFADVRNRVSIRWLQWLGFRFGEPFEFRGYSFRLFEMRSADVHSGRSRDGRANRSVDGNFCRRGDPAGSSGVVGCEIQCANRRDECDAC